MGAKLALIGTSRRRATEMLPVLDKHQDTREGGINHFYTSLFGRK
jgi:hypothetical protein